MSETTAVRDASIESSWSRDGAEAPGDDEFVRQLHLGSDHLAAGDVPAARVALELAVALRPKDAKAQGLLGLCYFKLGLLERAATTYVALVRDNPFDVTLHVNLGLVQLKSARLDAAIRTLEVATGLAPEHRKAQNYLGLAYAQSGEYERARDAFQRAGSAAKASEMERALAMMAARADTEPNADDRRTPTEPFLRVAPAAAAPAAAARAGAPATSASASVTSDEVIPSLAEVVRSSRLAWPRGSPFAIDPSGVSIDFAARIHTRVDGLVASRGDTTWASVRKRFAGRLIDRSFGAGPRQMWQASGGGQLFISSEVGGTRRVFSAIRLEEDAYFVEDRLYAFEDSVDAENGRVPGRGIDLSLVRLRGQGHLLLATERALKSEAVFGNESLRVPLSGLVGWTGPLTPKLLAMFEGPEGIWVELTGEGDVLLLA